MCEDNCLRTACLEEIDSLGCKGMDLAQPFFHHGSARGGVAKQAPDNPRLGADGMYRPGRAVSQAGLRAICRAGFEIS